MTKSLKIADKSSGVDVWDRDDYIKEAEKQLGDKDIHEELYNDCRPLIKTIHKAIEKIRKRGDQNADTIKYFTVKEPKFALFCLLLKIHKNISSFLDFHLQLLAWEVKPLLF